MHWQIDSAVIGWISDLLLLIDIANVTEYHVLNANKAREMSYFFPDDSRQSKVDDVSLCF